MSVTTVPTTIRKKWNSPLSSEVPRSKLPAYKPSTQRAHKNPTTSTPPTRSNSKSSCPTSQTGESKSSVKPSPSKELQNEIAKLKKELATVKTENSILKVKVRRVDDENIQKSKQIEKLRAELKAVQKVESATSKKSKESELLLLRQKCLRLEGALKEKDLALKRLNNVTSLKVEGTGSKKNTSQLETGDTDNTKQDKLNETVTLEKSSLAAHTSQFRSSQSIKSETTKLREMIHKLENENQELQQQVKDKGEEIRRLKVHLRSQTYTKSSQSSSKTSVPNITSQTSVSKSIPKVQSSIKLVSTVPNQVRGSKSKESLNSNKSKSLAIKNTKAPFGEIKKTQQIIPRAPTKIPDPSQKSNTKRNRKNSSSGKNSSSSGISKPQIVSKQINGTQSKLPITRPGKTFVVTKRNSLKSESTNPTEKDLEDKVQRLRENMAAKKIQRGWRNHQKLHLNSEDHQNSQKAMTFIVTSIKHHKSRKEKLNTLQRRKNQSPRLKVENESVLVEAIQAATKNLWVKELSVNN